jgi:hypothetical protein
VGLSVVIYVKHITLKFVNIEGAFKGRQKYVRKAPRTRTQEVGLSIVIAWNAPYELWDK